MNYTSGSHTVFQHRYHIVWITRYRYKVLEGALRERIRTIIRQVCKELGVQIVSGILSREHVHMLVEIPPHQPVSDFVRRVKGRSSHRLQRKFSDLRMFVRLDPLRDLRSGNVGQFNIQHYEIGFVQAREFQRFDAASLRLGKGL